VVARVTFPSANPYLQTSLFPQVAPQKKSSGNGLAAQFWNLN